MLKKTRCAVLSALLLITTLSTSSEAVYASSDLPESNSKESLKKTYDKFYFTKRLYDDHGRVTGTVEQEVQREIEVLVDGTKIVTLTQDETEVPDVRGKAAKKHRTVDTIKVTKNGEYFINNEKLSKEVLQQSIVIPTLKKYGAGTPTYSPVYYEKGGIYGLTYYQEKSRNYFAMRTYPDANFFMDYGQGTLRTKNSYGSYFVSDFKNYAIAVDDARTNIVFYSTSLAGTLGVAVVTVVTVIGALTAIGAAGFAAYQIYDASQDGHTYMKNAYSVLGKM